MRQLLLATTALAGTGLLAFQAGAAEIGPGGALDVQVSGFARFLAAGGGLDAARLDDGVTTGLDFFNDTEVYVVLKGKHDATGIEYGGKIELEADTSATANADETWIFLRGGFGEVILGDEDGVADYDGAAVSAATLAAGTGGLEGDVVEVFGGGVRTEDPLGTSDATKIIYKAPTFAGFGVSASYTPNLNGINSSGGNGDALAVKDVAAGDVVEGALTYKKGILQAALTGLYGDIKTEDTAGGDDYWAVQAGAVVDVFGIKLGGSYLTEEAGGIEADAISAGVGGKLGIVSLSLNYGQIIDSDGIAVGEDEIDHPWTVIVSATVPLMPGLTLDGDLGYFDNDVDGDPVGADDDNGWQGVVRLALMF